MEEASEALKLRMDKLKALNKKGYPVYGKRFPKSSIGEILKDFSVNREVKVAGRIMARRSHGKAAFADLRDSTGKIQLYFKEDIIGEEDFSFFNGLDIGDIIGAEGATFKTKTAEPSIKVQRFCLLAKSLRPLPEKWHGLKDVELRSRKRYLDLLANEESRKTFLMRTEILSLMREFLNSKGFIEVETPMMHPIPGGATGRPFKTYHHEFDAELYLRIAPELYLKRLLVAGFEKVYEINRSFRNEGISTRHNPEFTMLELYLAYADYTDMMSLTEGLISTLAKDLLGTTQINYQNKKIDLTPPWKRWSFAKGMKERFDIGPDEKLSVWIEKLRKGGVDIPGKELTRSQVINIIEELVEPESKGSPTFVIDLFTELSPLAKAKEENPLLAERFELFIGGLEVANAYSELNDPIEQRQRLKGELAEETDRPKTIDEDFLKALEYGMPPAGGLGIGIDRLAMIFTNRTSIREVILFPLLRPQELK